MPAVNVSSASEHRAVRGGQHPQAVRVLVIMPVGHRRGGAELALRNLLEPGRDDEIIWQAVFLEHGPMVQEITDLGIETAVVDAGRMRQPLRFALAALGTTRLARRNQADVVLSWMTKGQVYGGIVSALSRRPGVWYQVGIPSRRSWLEWVAALLPARLILTCSGTGATAQRHLWPRRAVSVAYPGITLDQFDAATLPPSLEARRQLGLPADGPLIGTVGRLQSWKGMHVLIEAMPAIVDAHPDAHCVILGECHDREPGYLSYLEELVDRLGLREHVHLLVQRSSPLWIQAMTVVSLVSDQEPFGIVVLEAMALAKPVVAGDIGGPTELIVHDQNGALVRFGDAVALCRAICKFIDDPQLAAKTGAAAHTRAQEFSVRRFRSRFSAALTDLAPERP